jgi:DNA-binding FadR family transcriptional regulator
VEARRGSGITVRAAREWSLDVLPAYLRYGSVDPERLGAVIADLLALRRALFLDQLRIVGDRFEPGSLEEARAAIARAWEVREDAAQFIAHDLDAIRLMMESARLLPAVWLLNGFGGVYAAIARGMTGHAIVPSDYRATWSAVFDALERGHVTAASRKLNDYLERHDRRLLSALGIDARARSSS